MPSIGIAALGTRGDVMPFIELGRGLRAAGHTVTISTTASFESLAVDAGLGFHRLAGEPSEMFGAVGFDPSAISPRRPLAHLRLIHSALSALVGQTSDADLLDAWQEVDFAIFSPTTTFARAAADRLRISAAMVALTPSLTTGAFAHPVLTPAARLGRWGNRATWLAGERLQRQTFSEPLKPAARAEWGLASFPLAAPRSGSRWPPFPILHAYSGVVVPRPPDWPAHVHVTGWIFPPRSAEPLGADVEHFLSRGEPPLYVGFGSMPLGDAERAGRVLLGALARNDLRAIVSGDGLASAACLRDSERVLVAGPLPHDVLFERVAAAVHHGGSGTVGSSLRAGLPTLVIPTVFDQFFWGARVAALGAGPPPLPFHRLTAERLTAALAELGSPRIRAAATAVSTRVAGEAGLTRAIETIGGVVR